MNSGSHPGGLIVPNHLDDFKGAGDITQYYGFANPWDGWPLAFDKFLTTLVPRNQQDVDHLPSPFRPGFPA
jgi:hypothetical protein